MNQVQNKIDALNRKNKKAKDIFFNLEGPNWIPEANFQNNGILLHRHQIQSKLVIQRQYNNCLLHPINPTPTMSQAERFLLNRGREDVKRKEAAPQSTSKGQPKNKKRVLRRYDQRENKRRFRLLISPFVTKRNKISASYSTSIANNISLCTTTFGFPVDSLLN